MVAGIGRKLSDAYVELRADDSKLIPEVKIKAQRVGKEFGGQLNRQLKALKLDGIDIKANPKDALSAIDATRDRLRLLADDAATVEIRIKAEDAIRNLDRVKKRIGDIGDDPRLADNAARGFAAKFGARLGPLMAHLPISAPILGAVAGVGAAAAPLLGAAIAGGIIGGAGIGGVVGGLVLAARDKRVADAASQIADRLEERLNSAAGAFVSPALQGLDQIERAADRIDIEAIFRDSARFVPALTRGAVSAIDDLGESIELLIRNAGPSVAAISGGIALIGQQLSAGLASLADNGKTAGDALATLLGVVSSVTQNVFLLTNMLTELYGISQKLGGDSALTLILKLTGNEMKDTGQAADLMGQSTEAAGGSFTKIKAAIETAGTAASTTAVKFEAIHEAALRITGSNLSAAEATLSLRNAVTSAGDAVDKKSKVSRAEEGALLAMARATNTSTKALDEQGRTVAQATAAHETNRKKLYETARAMGYSKTEAKKLADQYLATPKNVPTKIEQPGMTPAQRKMKDYDKQIDDITRHINTKVVVTGDTVARNKLEKLLIQQQALKKGISVSAAAAAFNKNAYYGGGWTGPGPKYQKAGDVHADEFVIRKEARQKIEHQMPGLLDAMNRTGKAPGYAAGGQVLDAPFVVTAAMTRIPSLAEALSKVIGAFGNWPSSPGAQRGDSGVWRRIVALIRSTGPFSGSFGNGYRPGDPKWHGSGRAVDWMGFNQDRLAAFLAARKPLELIHRTSTRDFAYTRGRNMGSFNEGLMNAHRNHIHAAFAEGGRVPIASVARADTGRATLERGWNLIQNSTGKQEHMAVGMEDAVSVLRDVLSAILRLAPAMGEEVGRRVGGGRADAVLGARAGLMERTV